MLVVCFLQQPPIDRQLILVSSATSWFSWFSSLAETSIALILRCVRDMLWALRYWEYRSSCLKVDHWPLNARSSVQIRQLPRPLRSRGPLYTRIFKPDPGNYHSFSRLLGCSLVPSLLVSSLLFAVFATEEEPEGQGRGRRRKNILLQCRILSDTTRGTFDGWKFCDY